MLNKTENVQRDYALYQVGLKILLKRGKEVLFLRVTDGKWDFPGGRIDNVEGETPLMGILNREIREEIGTEVTYRVGGPLFQFRRTSGNDTYNLLTVYDGEFLGGTIKLSHEHKDFTWINPTTIILKREDFGAQEEYEAVKSYFNQLKN